MVSDGRAGDGQIGQGVQHGDQAVLPAEVPAAYLVPHQSFTAKAVGAEMAAYRVIQAFLQPEPPVRLPRAAR